MHLKKITKEFILNLFKNIPYNLKTILTVIIIQNFNINFVSFRKKKYPIN